MEYRKATLKDLNRRWDMEIAEHNGHESYCRWKAQFISDNQSGAAATFMIIDESVPVGQGTLLLSPACRAVRGRTKLCDGETVANINALRIDKPYEAQGHISRLMQEIEQYARRIGISRLTIGVEAAETRNLGIYLHWGYDRFLFSEIEDDTLVLYYVKDL